MTVSSSKPYFDLVSDASDRLTMLNQAVSDALVSRIPGVVMALYLCWQYLWQNHAFPRGTPLKEAWVLMIQVTMEILC